MARRGTKPSPSFVENFCKAVKQARIAAGLTQQEIADILGIGRASYENYENRSLLPLHLIVRFCLHTDTTFARLIDQANNPQSLNSASN